MRAHQFKYIFTAQVEHALRYSIEEAVRKNRKRGKDIASEAIASFRRKMNGGERDEDNPKRFVIGEPL